MTEIKKVVYVAGPFRSLSEPYNFWEQEQNIRAAEEVALSIWLSGHVALCPHAMTRNYQGAAPDEVWISGDLALLSRCDLMLVLPGWEISAGTLREIEHAKKEGILVFYSVGELMSHIVNNVSTE